MLIHISRLTDVHIKVKQLVEIYFGLLAKDVKAYGALANSYHQSIHLQAIKETFRERLQNIEFDFETVLIEICKIIDSVIIVDVHQRAKHL